MAVKHHFPQWTTPFVVGRTCWARRQGEWRACVVVKRRANGSPKVRFAGGDQLLVRRMGDIQETRP